MQRRDYLRATGGLVLAGAVAGCDGDGDGGDGPGDNEVIVGPNSNLRFDPETITVDVGTTVTWTFDSANHNVSFTPDHHGDVSIPDGVDPFASVDSAFDTNDQGSTWSHTFDVAGEYDYVCVPHAASGMQGTVVVEE